MGQWPLIFPLLVNSNSLAHATLIQPKEVRACPSNPARKDTDIIHSYPTTTLRIWELDAEQRGEKRSKMPDNNKNWVSIKRSWHLYMDVKVSNSTVRLAGTQFKTAGSLKLVAHWLLWMCVITGWRREHVVICWNDGSVSEQRHTGLMWSLPLLVQVHHAEHLRVAPSPQHAWLGGTACRLWRKSSVFWPSPSGGEWHRQEYADWIGASSGS